MKPTKRNKQKAVRQASEKMAERLKEVVAREKKVTATLAQYLQHRQAADAVVDTARQRAEALIAAAQHEATGERVKAGEALAALEGLGESRSAIAEMTEMSIGEVRAAIAETTNHDGQGQAEAVPR